MDNDLPFVDQQRVARAAEGMISNHGANAFAVADQRAQVLRSAGRDTAAATWESISELIQVRLGDCPDARRSAHCRLCGGVKLTMPAWPAPEDMVLCLDCGTAESFGELDCRLRAGEGGPHS